MAKNTADSGGIGKALKKYLITGILVWLPIAVTLWVITYIVSASDQLINLLPEHWQPMHLIGFNIPGLGVIVAVLVLFVTGLFGANVLGRRIIAAWDALLGRIPVVKSIYSSVKRFQNRCCLTTAVRLKHRYWCRFRSRIFGRLRLFPAAFRRWYKKACLKRKNMFPFMCRPRPTPPAVTTSW